MKYRKKLGEIKAVQWLGSNYEEIEKFCYGIDFGRVALNPEILYITTLEGIIQAAHNDWIIKNMAVAGGEFYTCKPDIFEKTYEKVEDNG